MRYIILFVVIYFLSGCSEPETHHIIKKGRVERVVYTPSDFWSNGDTVIYFKDSSTFVLHGHVGVPAECIKIDECRNCSLPYRLTILTDKGES